MNIQESDLFNEKIMKALLYQAEETIEGEYPTCYIAAIVRDSEIISISRNTNKADKDPTAHAEINAIRDAAKKMNNRHLEKCILFTICEPCPMCFSAAWRAKISKIVYGMPISDILDSRREINISSLFLNEKSNGNKIEVIGGVLRNEVLAAYKKINNGAYQKVYSKNILTRFAEEDFYAKSIPHYNIYQYPEPAKQCICEQSGFEKKLCLNKDKSGNRFTLFISVAYCQSKCNSRPFYKNIIKCGRNKEELLGKYVQNILMQIKKYSEAKRFRDALCMAVYFGGGTASLLSIDQVKMILEIVKSLFNLEDEIEITLEASPVHLTAEYVNDLKKCGVNRVSIGLQTFNNLLLKKSLNSPHNHRQGFDAVKNALSSSFNVVNVDLMYSIPNQEKQDWILDIENIILFEPENITLNQYKVFSGSTSEGKIKRGVLNEPKGNWTWYFYAKERLEENGYVETRFGTFIKPRCEQKYGIYSYGSDYEIIGVGAGAYSFINGFLFRASGNAERFYGNIERGIYQIGDYVSKKASIKDRMKRYIMYNLYNYRISRYDIKVIFSKDVLEFFSEEIERLLELGLISVNEDTIEVLDVGKQHIKRIVYEFF